MFPVFLSLIPVGLVGALLRQLMPGAEEARLTLNRLVLYAFLPALVFHTVMTCPLDGAFILVPIAAAVTVLAVLAIAFPIFHFLPIPSETKGAMMLAAAFGNVTYLGVPLLQGLFPQNILAASTVAVLFEVTKSTLNLTLGAMIAISYGSHEPITLKKTAWEALKLPPIWALAAALLWRATGLSCPAFLLQGAGVMAAAVSGIMILSLGMALRIRATRLMALVIPVALLKLLVSPAIAYFIAAPIGLTGLVRDLTILEAAMPSQLLSFVIAARFKLDEATLSFVIFGNTLLSLVTLPLVHSWLG